MKVKDIMTRTVEMVGPQDTLQTAAMMMKTHDIGVLPVNDGGRVVGIVTDRDIVVRGTAAGKDPKSTPASEAMSTDVVTCRTDDRIEDVARTMKERQIRRVVVLDEGKRVAGIVSLGDLAGRPGTTSARVRSWKRSRSRRGAASLRGRWTAGGSIPPAVSPFQSMSWAARSFTRRLCIIREKVGLSAE